MRHTIFLVFTLSLTSCASPPTQKESLSLEHTHSQISPTDIQMNDTTTISLVNVQFETPRRMERDLSFVEPTSTPAPRETIQELAFKTIQSLYPGSEAKEINVQQGTRFIYVTFQQMVQGIEIFGAKTTLRLTPQGEWFTVSSTFIHPSLLHNLNLEPSQALKTEDYFQEAHVLLSEREVIYPRLNENQQLELFQAKEWVLFSLEDHQEHWLWINEVTGEALGAHTPSTQLDKIEVRGTISPNSPDDIPTPKLFPSVTAELPNKRKIKSDYSGYFPSKDIQGQQFLIALENETLSILNGKKAARNFPYDLTQTVESINLDQGPSLEERNVYFWLMQARKYLLEKLKYQGMKYQLMAMVNYGEKFDNAFYMPMLKTLSFGEGGTFLKNTALSRDIVLHEYGHAVTHEIYGLVGGYEFAAMNEAWSDYFAASITNDSHIAEGALTDKINRPYLRTVENDLEYPKSYLGNRFHDDGQIFSGALWDLRKKLGAERVDIMIHEARLAQAKTIFEFYKELMAIDEDGDDLNPFTPSPNHEIIRKAFFRHGLGHHNVTFNEIKENLTMPWKPPSEKKLQGCWNVNE